MENISLKQKGGGKILNVSFYGKTTALLTILDSLNPQYH